ncbi:hypothetical protein HIM_05193 [Hirsutella minnesotensis 3608]|uniref:Major facilitator superfamily (MFS) profile domain-containing protein n=1 Tax=Hirsutella minnesotensis 3608 TaxID=1043627 RepID=A0A0F8A0N0_9HYPO|nr:hypothetical protein HIM_05193 [Hirsutella minnesotensis 3608]
MAITWGGTQFPWGSWQTLVPLIAGSTGLVVAAIWEVRFAAHPFLRVALLKSRSRIAAYVCALLQGLMMFCTLYYLPIYFEGVKGYSPSATGLSLMPITGSLLPFGIIVGVVIRITGRFRWAVWSGWAISILSSGLLILLGTGTQVGAWVMILIVVGLGHGLVLISLNICTQALVHTSHVVHAVVMYTFARTAGMCIGVSVGGALFQSTLGSQLEAKGLPSAWAHDTGSLLGHPIPPMIKDPIISSITQSCRSIAQLLLGVAVAGCLVSLLIKSSSVEKEFNPVYKLQKTGERVEDKA